MASYEQIKQFAESHPNQACIIEHEIAIVNLESGARVFDITKAAATYIVESKEGMFAVVASAVGHLKWRQLGRVLGLHQIHLASPEMVKEHTGYDVGTVGPLFLNGVRMFFDNRLLQHDMVYCGTEDAHHTLAIAPKLIIDSNDIAGYFNSDEYLK
ncbi:aminoacyl-tRNA deacylase [Bifidobacterium felsineum]|uniref:YbaK/aminoacyl-tRNA synthetase-associated domain-containing protein n=1 Tax=Bifidobacterium felsineum TaxID=2045440 RepID=A0A2M9HK60_9BIFI|nr:YbaK/EbsC family protein [Bifidobacterium felsineum]MBT1164819.1 YbaK/EbsC family protein [Bifidobacterium felsineum]PJM77206.1 hypothetical protein CSQ86_04750 [Bifidobacterium felsineum]